MVTTCPLIVCKSVHHGNTAKVAEAMADVLEADVASPEGMPSTRLMQYPLVGFGSGVFYGRMHDGLSELLQGLPEVPKPLRPAFVFSTSGLPWLAWYWHRPLRRLLARKGFQLMGEFSCGGHDTWGPLGGIGGLNRTHPDSRDLERARTFATEMARRLSSVEARATCLHCG